MSVAELSRTQVEGRLAALEESYDFPLNQTTLTVSAPVYEQARDRCDAGLVDLYVSVRNDDDDVLLVSDDDGLTLPYTEPTSDQSLEACARRAVEERTGVECSITGLDRVTILGVTDEDDPDSDPVYRLVTVFAGEYLTGTPAEQTEWRSGPSSDTLPAY